MSDLNAVDTYLAILAKHGVKTIGPVTFDGNSFPPVEMHDRGAVIDGAIVPKTFTMNAPHEATKCVCGHEMAAHDGNGVCYFGSCSPETCAKSPKQ